MTANDIRATFAKHHSFRIELLFVLLVACGTTRPATVAVPPHTPPPVPKEAPCVIDGPGEPLDPLVFHEMPELALAAARSGPPLVHTQGSARHELHGRWTEISPAGGDRHARLELNRTSEFTIVGYADLSAVRFRLRREAAVVPAHVFLEADVLVRLTGAEGPFADIAADVPFDTPKELTTRVACDSLGYEPIVSEYRDAPADPTGHVSTLRLFDAPRGNLRFEAKVGLIFVREVEERDGWVRIEGERHRARFAGWTPRDLVDHEPTGSGYGAGGRSSSMTKRKGRAAVVARDTPLLLRRGEEAPVAMGKLLAGAKITILSAGGDLAALRLDDGAVDAVDGAVMLVSTADVSASAER